MIQKSLRKVDFFEVYLQLLPRLTEAMDQGAENMQRTETTVQGRSSPTSGLNAQHQVRETLARARTASGTVNEQEGQIRRF